MSYVPTRECRDCGAPNPWSEQCTACELLERADARHESELQRLHKELAEAKAVAHYFGGLVDGLHPDGSLPLIAAALEAAKFIDKDGHCSVFAGALALANLWKAAEAYRKAVEVESRP